LNVPAFATSPLPAEHQDSTRRNESSGENDISLKSTKELKGMKILTTKKKTQLLEENQMFEEALEELYLLIDTAENLDEVRSAIGSGPFALATSMSAESVVQDTSAKSLAAISEL
jgi:hypothetical protein